MIAALLAALLGAVSVVSGAPVAEAGTEPEPLAGRTIVLDAGHQLGNANFPAQINRPVPAGGFTKPCNTTGTATNGGYPEATFNFAVASALRDRLTDAGATVVMVRKTNRADLWGPCIDVRGRAGNAIDADLKISIHADGSYVAGARGFHVIAPVSRAGWTADIAEDSRQLALDVRAGLESAGLPRANYIAGGDGLDFRSDLGTLNLSDVPTVMVEAGNMRNADEAGRMSTASGRSVYVNGLLRGVLRYLD